MIARRSDDAVFTAWATGRGCAWRRAVRCSSSVHASRQDVVARHNPRCCGWSDALVVTSVKNDVITTTRDWRASGGRSPSPRAGTRRRVDVEPPRGCSNPPSRVSCRTRLDKRTGRSWRYEFWNSLATKVVGSFTHMLAIPNARVTSLTSRERSRSANSINGSTSPDTPRPATCSKRSLPRPQNH